MIIDKMNASKEAPVIDLEFDDSGLNGFVPTDPDLEALSMIETSLKDFSDIDIMGTRLFIMSYLYANLNHHYLYRKKTIRFILSD